MLFTLKIREHSHRTTSRKSPLERKKSFLTETFSKAEKVTFHQKNAFQKIGQC